MPFGWNNDGTPGSSGGWIAQTHDGGVLGGYCYLRYGFQPDGGENAGGFWPGHTPSDVYPTDPITGGYRVGYAEVVQDDGDITRGILPGFLIISNNIYSEYNWSAVFDPLVFQDVPNQETPHGQVTMRVQQIDRTFDYNSTIISNYGYIGAWDWDSDWDEWQP